MLSKFRTGLLVTLFALVLWIFAESESLGEYTGLTTIRFAGGEGRDRLIFPRPGFQGTVNVNLVGSKSAIARSERVLAGGIALEPGLPGVPTTDGRHAVDLLQALQGFGPLNRTGVRVAGASPQIIEVEVVELATHSAAVEPVLEGVEVVGEVRVNPDRVTIRLPRGALAQAGDSIRVQARLNEARARRLPASGTAREEVPLSAPASVASLPGFEMDRTTATVEFTIRSRSASESFRSIPVQAVLPPVEIGRWLVEVDTEDRFLAATVAGPPESLERIRSGAEALIALVALSSDDLASRVRSKDATFALLKGGAIGPLPPDLSVAAERTLVRLLVSPVEPAGSGRESR